MKLFENGVGRPSNEIKKKRKIFVTLAASIIIILIGGVALLFNFNEKNLKGVATNNDFYITSSLDNNTLYLNKNTEQLKIVGLSNKDDVKWESSNDKIVKVDKNGKVTAKKIGKTSITVKTKDGKKKSFL